MHIPINAIITSVSVVNFDEKMENSDKKMLREIANDNITPKKYDFSVQNDLYEKRKDDFEEDGLDYDMDSIPLAEF
tara:strand:- start:11147 stop:11374 length:228 start_codon:yes stop_codon:yes gene_type:complete